MPHPMVTSVRTATALLWQCHKMWWFTRALPLKTMTFCVNKYWRMKKKKILSKLSGKVRLGQVTGPTVHSFELMQNCPPFYWTSHCFTGCLRISTACCTAHQRPNRKVQNHKPCYKKYGVVFRGGITRSESGTAWYNFAARESTSVKERTAAMLPHR